MLPIENISISSVSNSIVSRLLFISISLVEMFNITNNCGTSNSSNYCFYIFL